MTREQLLTILSSIMEPALERSLVEMQWIRDVMIKDEGVSMTIVCLEKGPQVEQMIQEQISEQLEQSGVSIAKLRFREASEYERNAALGSGEQAEAPVHRRSIVDSDSKTEFIAIASGKGGVGKSTVSVNLAVALARQGKRVGLIDADIYGFSVPDMMGIEDAPVVEDNIIIPVERFGVQVMSMGFFIQDNNPVIWRGPMLGKMLRQFLDDVRWGDLDYMLLDLPPGTGDIALDVHQMIPECSEIIVTTPHATAAFVAARAGAMALKTEHEVLGVVENMAYYECDGCGNKDYIFGKGGGARLAETLRTQLLAQIPIGAPDNHVSEPDFSPSVYKADSKAGNIYIDLADRIINKS